jgi:uroporphyrinogen decarboxylase
MENRSMTHAEGVLDARIYERIVTAASHAEPDRVPIWDYLDNRATMDHFAPGQTDLLRANVAVYHALGIDLCRGFGGSYAESDDGTRTEHTRISGRTNWLVDYPIKTLEDLARHPLPEVDASKMRAEWIPHNRRLIEAFAPATMYVPGWGCGFHAVYGLMGLELFSFAIFDRPDEVDRLLDGYGRQAVAAARLAAEANLGPLFFIGDDIAYKDRLMFSPDYLRRTCVRMVAAMCEPLNRAGVKVIFHSDGNVTAILDDLVEAGIAGINPIEPLAGMDIGVLKRRYGKRLILVGNVDCSVVLPLGTREEVVRATRACLRAAAPGGGHFIGSSSEITPATPLENVLAFYETCRNDGRYPIRC